MGPSKLLVWGERLLRWAIAGIFLAAAIPKIMDPVGFALDTSHYRVFPDWSVNIIAVVMPWIEAVAGLALLSGFAAEGSILLANLMFVAFLGLLGQAWVRGLDIDCGCFGHAEAKGHIGMAFLRDVGFLALGLASAWLRWRRTRRPLGSVIK